jgi:hypothetical protein
LALLMKLTIRFQSFAILRLIYFDKRIWDKSLRTLLHFFDGFILLLIK